MSVHEPLERPTESHAYEGIAGDVPANPEFIDNEAFEPVNQAKTAQVESGAIDSHNDLEEKEADQQINDRQEKIQDTEVQQQIPPRQITQENEKQKVDGSGQQELEESPHDERELVITSRDDEEIVRGQTAYIQTKDQDHVEEMEDKTEQKQSQEAPEPDAKLGFQENNKVQDPEIGVDQQDKEDNKQLQALREEPNSVNDREEIQSEHKVQDQLEGEQIEKDQAPPIEAKQLFTENNPDQDSDKQPEIENSEKSPEKVEVEELQEERMQRSGKSLNGKPSPLNEPQEPEASSQNGRKELPDVQDLDKSSQIVQQGQKLQTPSMENIPIQSQAKSTETVMLKEEKEEDCEPHPMRMTEQNEAVSENDHNIQMVQDGSSEKIKEIVEFQEFTPQKISSEARQRVEPVQGREEDRKASDCKSRDEDDTIVKENQHSKKDQQDRTSEHISYINGDKINNQNLLKRIQELQQTVQHLKKTSKEPVSTKQQPQEKSTIDKKAHHIIHEPSVHNLVAELSKKEQESGGTAPKTTLHEKKSRRRKLDLTSLMDKNMVLESNIFSLTIGEILLSKQKAADEEKDRLKKQIRQLRDRVVKMEEEKRALSSNRGTVPYSTRRESMSTEKKSVCGKLIKVSEMRRSRVSGIGQASEAQFRIPSHQAYDLGERSRKSSFKDNQSEKKNLNFSFTQRADQEGNSSGFRVRRPSARTSLGNTAPNFSASNLEEARNYDRDNSDIKISFFPVTGESPSQQYQREPKEDKEWWSDPFITKVQLPDMPSPPTQFDSQEDLFNLAKIVFMAFDVPLNPNIQVVVKKYKNCVYFNAGEKYNVLWYFDGRFYIGEWLISVTGEGEKSGLGLEYLPGKYIYKGEFVEGKRHGRGAIKILNKEKQVVYDGQWVQGVKCGFGKQEDEQGIKYEGCWKQNKRDGFGKLKLPDGDIYEGNFERGIKTGFGIEYFKNGDKYEGEYLSNKFHGKGKYYWKNGSVYEGDFVNGIRSGEGNWRSSSVDPQCDSYVGEYDKDKKNGFGKYQWADGSEYEGYFKDDLKDGEGTIRYKNGKVAKLLWRNGQPMKKMFSEQEKNYRESQKESIKRDSQGHSRKRFNLQS